MYSPPDFPAEAATPPAATGDGRRGVLSPVAELCLRFALWGKYFFTLEFSSSQYSLVAGSKPSSASPLSMVRTMEESMSRPVGSYQELSCIQRLALPTIRGSKVGC